MLASRLRFSALLRPASWRWRCSSPAAQAQAPTCPCTLFATSRRRSATRSRTRPLEVGMPLQVRRGRLHHGAALLQPGRTTSGRTPATSGRPRGTLLARSRSRRTGTGWQEADLASPVAITAGTVYITSYYPSTGRFAFNLGAFNSGRRPRRRCTRRPTSDGGNGVYRYGRQRLSRPTPSTRTNYWVDAVFDPSVPADTRPPHGRARPRRPPARPASRPTRRSRRPSTSRWTR